MSSRIRDIRYSWRLPMAAAFAVTLLSGADALGQGFFESLFGRQHRSEAASDDPRPPVPLPYAEPAAPTLPTAPGVSITISPLSGAPTVNFCVRLCDGRYFPIQRQTNMTPVRTCSALCPAATTKVFAGSEIGQARAADGTPYGNLNKAYVYRTKLVPDCTCNGKTPFGLAKVDVAGDPTLKAGDMIATETGLVKFTGSMAQLRRSIGAAPDKPEAARRKVAADSRVSTR